MHRSCKSLIAAGVFGFLAIAAPTATAGELPDQAEDHASCMGSGSSFYGTFAPQQRAFVAAYVIDQARESGGTPGATYASFAQEKEGGAIPAPCGTRIE